MVHFNGPGIRYTTKMDDGIHYCPSCGQNVEPLFAFMSAGAYALVAECPEHGVVEIEFSKDSHRDKTEPEQ